MFSSICIAESCHDNGIFSILSRSSPPGSLLAWQLAATLHSWYPCRFGRGCSPELAQREGFWRVGFGVFDHGGDDQRRKGGHGGGDVRLLNHVFRGADDDPLGHAAGYFDGAASIMTGISANESMKTGEPVIVDALVDLGALRQITRG